MEKQPTLIVSIPDATAQSYELKGERIGLGREADNQIAIPIDQLSSNHCEFRRTASGYEIIDLNSTNGTRVNGKKITVHPLADGDRLLLGESLPAHFVELAAGEKREEVAVEGSDEQNKAATSYATMDEKLQAIEASIAARQSEYESLEASLKSLEAQIAAKKQEGGADSEEVRELEKDLMLKTKRIQVMKMDIAQQRANLQQRPASHPAPIQIQPISPVPIAPVQQQPAQQQPAQQQPAQQQPVQQQPVQQQPLPQPPVRQQPRIAPPGLAVPPPPAGAPPAPIPIAAITRQLSPTTDGKRTVPVPAPPKIGPRTGALIVEEGKSSVKLNFGKKP